MSRGLRWWGQAVTPPIVVIGTKEGLRRLGVLGRPAFEPEAEPVPDELPEWEYAPEGFARQTRGWDVEAVADAYAAKWSAYLEALDGNGPLGVYHEAPVGDALPTDDLGAQTMLLAYAYVAALAACQVETLRVLDYGGGLGHYAALTRRVLPDVSLDYTCHELPAVVARGRALHPGVRFCDDETCLARTYDLVVASSSLQYEEDWAAHLRRLAGVADGYLYVTRLPVALEASSFAVVQHAERYGYATEYVGWVIARAELLEVASTAGLDLVREFILDAWLAADGAPESPIGHRGFLFRPLARS